MIKKEVIIVVFLIGITTLILGCQPKIKEVEYSQAVPNYTVEILQKFQESEYVRVTVALKEPPATFINKSSPTERHQQKKAYTESIANRLLSNLNKSDYELIGTLTQGFIIRVNKEDYLKLLESRHIEQIYPEREVKTIKDGSN